MRWARLLALVGAATAPPPVLSAPSCAFAGPKWTSPLETSPIIHAKCQHFWGYGHPYSGDTKAKVCKDARLDTAALCQEHGPVGLPKKGCPWPETGGSECPYKRLAGTEGDTPLGECWCACCFGLVPAAGLPSGVAPGTCPNMEQFPGNTVNSCPAGPPTPHATSCAAGVQCWASGDMKGNPPPTAQGYSGTQCQGWESADNTTTCCSVECEPGYRPSYYRANTKDRLQFGCAGAVGAYSSGKGVWIESNGAGCERAPCVGSPDGRQWKGQCGATKGPVLGDNCTAECATGYEPKTSQTTGQYMCAADGNWTQTVPAGSQPLECKLVGCKEFIPPHSHNNNDCPSADAGQICNSTCKVGRYRTGGDQGSFICVKGAIASGVSFRGRRVHFH